MAAKYISCGRRKRRTTVSGGQPGGIAFDRNNRRHSRRRPGVNAMLLRADASHSLERRVQRERAASIRCPSWCCPSWCHHLVSRRFDRDDLGRFSGNALPELLPTVARRPPSNPTDFLQAHAKYLWSLLSTRRSRTRAGWPMFCTPKRLFGEPDVNRGSNAVLPEQAIDCRHGLSRRMARREPWPGNSGSSAGSPRTPARPPSQKLRAETTASIASNSRGALLCNYGPRRNTPRASSVRGPGS